MRNRKKYTGESSTVFVNALPTVSHRAQQPTSSQSAALSTPSTQRFYTASDLLVQLQQEHVLFPQEPYHYYTILLTYQNTSVQAEADDMRLLLDRTNRKLFADYQIKQQRADVIHCDAVLEFGSKTGTPVWHWHGVIYCEHEQNLARFIAKAHSVLSRMKKKSMKLDFAPLDPVRGGLDGWLAYMCKMNRKEFNPTTEYYTTGEKQ